MAGIGFTLRKLARRDDLIGVLQGYAHSAFITSGPWLFTVLALAGTGALGARFLAAEELAQFRVVVIYNFCFSVVLTGPMVLVATRYLADRIFLREPEGAPGMLMATLGLSYFGSFLIAGPFYLFVSGLPPDLALAAVAAFSLTSGIWVVSIFLSALKDYLTVTLSFLFGMAAGVGGAFLLGGYFGPAGMVWGLSLGIAGIQFALIARVLAEYPYSVNRVFAFLAYFRRYWDLALIGIVGNCAVWIDKWLMWMAPKAEVISSGMVIYTTYDSAMFFAYLTTVPALTLFTVNIETRFFEHYQGFYRGIQNHVTWAGIERNHRLVIRALIESSRNLIVLQGAVSALSIFLAPQIVGAMGLSFQQIGIFRFGVLGSLFQVLFLFATVVLSYFDLRRRFLFAQTFYLLANGGLTLFFARFGFPWYGYGYFLASLLAFLVAYLLVADTLRNLPYLAFVGNNPSVK